MRNFYAMIGGLIYAVALAALGFTVVLIALRWLLGV